MSTTLAFPAARCVRELRDLGVLHTVVSCGLRVLFSYAVRSSSSESTGHGIPTAATKKATAEAIERSFRSERLTVTTELKHRLLTDTWLILEYARHALAALILLIHDYYL
ncbi:hypothetical protein Pmar_PMAR013728 [Perkinsus marinus ATCC 50983]|uniref:Uncharacterized protein n=1 Tax=Perkinsus marinus (strain ATCC 50983 / TXsc) TaxID=423536 RepID=C5LY50_PERM5|nr:hypothetical protein Pmar_PMAR013728 [Perkinsus marinus ATCC 50983]EEQ98380.1 hypothetical protein Pmar_PMAR013728 [Perkinsus marinus ATCC 50983]|eukprot:XP_002765663.1 hypothetical protein Pmar_PMAR013728 [Perkinsus marinus ATCC 50983]